MVTSWTTAMSSGILLCASLLKILWGLLFILFWFSLCKEVSWQNLADVPINLQITMLKK